MPTTRSKLYKLIWNALWTEFGPWQEWYEID
jgi:aromatic ring hydroxylase